MSARAAIAKLTIVAAALAGAVSAAAQTAIESYHVQGNLHLLLGAGANVAVQVGEEGVIVVDTGAAASREALLAAVRKLSDRPIRWIINTNADVDHTGGNATISQAGMTVNGNPAAIVSHENVLARMTAANRPVTEMPLNTFFEAGRDFYFNGEAIFLYHVPNAHSDGDVMVYFRGSDVLVAGDLFVTTQYPVIDREAGGAEHAQAGGIGEAHALGMMHENRFRDALEEPQLRLFARRLRWESRRIASCQHGNGYPLPCSGRGGARRIEWRAKAINKV